jgi:hypothetical protein
MNRPEPHSLHNVQRGKALVAFAIIQVRYQERPLAVAALKGPDPKPNLIPREPGTIPLT